MKQAFWILVAVGLTATRVFAGPDIALCEITAVTSWGTLDGTMAYSIGTNAVNVGADSLDVIQASNRHPVLGHNMYRLTDGRFEQIGQSWVMHGFCALQLTSPCVSGCPGGPGCLQVLLPGCQDTHTSSRNGSHTLLGPKHQVNAHTGAFTFPYNNGDQGPGGDLTYKRLQVNELDLVDRALYFLEGQQVTPDDAAAGNQNNNASYRMITIAPSPTYTAQFVAGQGTRFGQAGVTAWRAHGNGIGVPDPDVKVENVQVPDDGLMIVATKASDNQDGTWHYEYAIQNLNSHRSVAGFSVPIASGVTLSSIGFHDVDYHSGDGPGGVNYDGTDWSVTVGAGAVTWSTQTEDENVLANALRWGTLYNFRFDADSPPTAVTATIGLYRAGVPAAVTVVTQGPQPISTPCPWDCEAIPDGAVGITDFLTLLANWDAFHPCDFNGNGVDIADFLQILANWGPCP